MIDNNSSIILFAYTIIGRCKFTKRRSTSLGEGGSGTLSYQYLLSSWKKGFRNGNWRKLNRIEKALYMASLSLAKMRGRIVNLNLVLKLRGIIGRLRETAGTRLMMSAYQRAIKLYDSFTATGLFEWAPKVRSWFNDPSYILWLGQSYIEPLPR